MAHSVSREGEVDGLEVAVGVGGAVAEARVEGVEVGEEVLQVERLWNASRASEAAGAITKRITHGKHQRARLPRAGEGR
jgi:hypothetical protein